MGVARGQEGRGGDVRHVLGPLAASWCWAWGACVGGEGVVPVERVVGLLGGVVRVCVRGSGAAEGEAGEGGHGRVGGPWCPWR